MLIRRDGSCTYMDSCMMYVTHLHDVCYLSLCDKCHIKCFFHNSLLTWYWYFLFPVITYTGKEVIRMPQVLKMHFYVYEQDFYKSYGWIVMWNFDKWFSMYVKESESDCAFSALMLFVGRRKGIQPVKTLSDEVLAWFKSRARCK